MWTEALRGKRAARGRFSARAQAGTRGNAEQASKSLMRRPTRRHSGEGCQRPETSPKMVANDTKPVASAGVVATACARRGADATREALSVARTRPPGTREGQLGPAGWRRGLEYRGSRVMPAEGRSLRSRGTSKRGVGIQIVSCDLAHIVPDTGRVRFSRTFVGEPGSPASLRHLAHCLGCTSGSDVDAGLARIISFRQQPPSGPV